jgi:hypothetical protein
VIRHGFSAIISAMPSRTDDRPRTAPEIETATESRVAVSPGATPARVGHDEYEPTEESFRAVFSSHQRAGRWEASDEIEARAIAGEITLDFTRADLPESGVVEIEAWAICGEIHIIVPDGAEVEIEGTPVLGAIEQQLRRKGAGQRIREFITGESEEDLPGPAPTVEPPFFHIEAHAILGNVKVTGR